MKITSSHLWQCLHACTFCQIDVICNDCDILFDFFLVVNYHRYCQCTFCHYQSPYYCIIGTPASHFSDTVLQSSLQNELHPAGAAGRQEAGVHAGDGLESAEE